MSDDLYYQIIPHLKQWHYTTQLQQHLFIVTQNLHSLSWCNRVQMCVCMYIFIYLLLYVFKHDITIHIFRRIHKIVESDY
jgi:hypothetical protein